MKKVWVALILIIYLLPNGNLYAETPNAGFVPGNIWYSKDPFEEGDKIRINTVIYNSDSRELLGVVVFFDDNVFLGKKDFTAPAKGVKDVSIDWMVTAGNHNIFAKIENAKFLISQGKYEDVYLVEGETSKSSRTINKKIIEKIIPNTTVNDITSSIADTGSRSIESFQNFVDDKTPNIITKPVIVVANAVETFRESVGTTSKNSKDKTKKEIAVLNKAVTEKDTDKNDNSNSKLIKPFKYVQLSAVALLSGVFNNKFIFYSLLIIVIFFILRYLWHLIF